MDAKTLDDGRCDLSEAKIMGAYGFPVLDGHTKCPGCGKPVSIINGQIERHSK